MMIDTSTAVHPDAAIRMPFSDVLCSEEDAMSLSLLVTAIADRLRTPLPEGPPTTETPPVPETPHVRRERLRREVLARGGTVTDIESIRGDCPAQTAQQIADLTRWLEQSA